MDRTRRTLWTPAACLLGLSFAACGGGGGGGGTVTPPSNSPPNPPAAGEVTVSGRITFDRPARTSTSALDFGSIERLPARGVTVEILRSTNGAVLATTSSDAAGEYVASVPGGALVVRAKARMRRSGAGGYDFEVRDNTSGNALYAIDSSTVNPSSTSVIVDLNARTGYEATTRNLTGPRESAPFAILDTLWRAKELIQEAEPGLTLPAIDVFWSTLNRLALPSACFGQPDPLSGRIGSSFYVGSDTPASASEGCAAVPRGIYVLGDSSGNADDDPDEFDSSVIAHEFAHFYEDAYSRSDSMGGPHSLASQLDLRLAMSEGWGNAFQGFVNGEGFYRDAVGPAGHGGFGFTLEGTRPFTEAVGFYSEASVMDFLWDAFDPANEPVDGLSLGFGSIHEVMRNEMADTGALTSLYVLASALAARDPASESAIRARLEVESVFGFGEYGDGERELLASTDEDAVPVYRQVRFGVPDTVVSTDRFREDDVLRAFNRLGARRYFRIDLPAGGGLDIVAQGESGSDPDFILYRRGVDQCRTGSACVGTDDSTADGRETATYSGLVAGTYVLEVFDCSNVGAFCRESPGPADRAITVTVTRR